MVRKKYPTTLELIISTRQQAAAARAHLRDLANDRPKTSDCLQRATDAYDQSRELIAEVDALLPELSVWEILLLQCLAAGDSDRAIAKQLRISTKAVEQRVLRLRQKLKARNRTHAVVIAMRGRIVW